MIALPAGKFHSMECAIDYANKKTAFKKKKELSADTRKRREALKTKSDYIKLAQKSVNEYIRERDRFKPCISCGSMNKTANSVDAGHYRSRGSAGHLRFYTLNIAAQCVRCNRDLSGNIVEMRKGMIGWLGEGKVKEIEHNNAISRFDIDYLKRLAALARKKTRMYRKIRTATHNR